MTPDQQTNVTMIRGTLDDAEKACKVLFHILKRWKLLQGLAVADEILGEIGCAKKALMHLEEDLKHTSREDQSNVRE